MKYIFKSKLILMISQIGAAMKRKNLKIKFSKTDSILLKKLEKNMYSTYR